MKQVISNRKTNYVNVRNESFKIVKQIISKYETPKAFSLWGTKN
ncbi:hypothetical protein M2138_000996 [Dysgonomonadaceae bacterium PH5-43]|nr:hypothetical protein [Dysgonomonadaceae bacterium PH5-43]